MNMINKATFDWKKYLLECMNSTDYCSIATVDDKGVWVNPVYFAWDEEFNFFFISMIPKVRHMTNIKNDPRVSMAISKTEQKGDVIGVYLEGQAKILEDEQERKHAHQTYYGRKGSLEQNEFALNNSKWFFVKVTPERIYYFNSNSFGEKRQEVPMGKLI